MIYSLIFLISLFATYSFAMKEPAAQAPRYEANLVPPLSCYALCTLLSTSKNINSAHLEGLSIDNKALYDLIFHTFLDSEKPLDPSTAYAMMYALWLKKHAIKIPEDLLQLDFFKKVTYFSTHEKLGDLVTNSYDTLFFSELLKFFSNKKTREQLLLQSALFSRRERVKICLAHGIDINCVDNQKNTPLHKAIKIGDPDVISLLLAYNPNLCLRNNDNHDALDEAYSYDLEYSGEKRRKTITKLIKNKLRENYEELKLKRLKQQIIKEEYELITDSKCLVM